MLVGAPLQGATSILPPRLCRPLCSSSSIESGGQSEEEERFKRPQDSSLQSILRSVPLARRGVEYVAPLASRGEFGRSVAHSPLLLPPPSRVLELSAGSTAAWSSRVHAADSSDGSMLVVAADLTPPADAAEGGPLPCSRQTACRSSEPSLSPQASPASLPTTLASPTAHACSTSLPSTSCSAATCSAHAAGHRGPSHSAAPPPLQPPPPPPRRSWRFSSTTRPTGSRASWRRARRCGRACSARSAPSRASSLRRSAGSLRARTTSAGRAARGACVGMASGGASSRTPSRGCSA
mmetsp:Transcript_29065/g.94631  ORF Transcript_29065/g.94631 Transcript_29065/m.94631 type:complete len:294 (-) Transcript_29065:201-1082(-)